MQSRAGLVARDIATARAAAAHTTAARGRLRRGRRPSTATVGRRRRHRRGLLLCLTGQLIQGIPKVAMYSISLRRVPRGRDFAHFRRCMLLLRYHLLQWGFVMGH